jgi:hypothetical protein
VFDTVRSHILNQPRSLQTRIGPSEIGHPCPRRLAYKLSGIERVREEDVAWKPYVGTSVHEQVAQIMASAEIARWNDQQVTRPRWYVEEQVTVGSIAGEEITGHTDLFDATLGIVWDWKFTSRNMLKNNYRPHGPGQQYRTQAHLYGRGWMARGFDVRHVGIIFLTRDGEFSDRYVWHEPYDEQVALDALERAATIRLAVETHGAETVLPMLPAVESYCGHCPWYKANSGNLMTGCPSVVKEVEDPLDLVFT